MTTRLNFFLLAALVASALYLVRVQYDSRRLYAEIERAQGDFRKLEVEFTPVLLAIGGAQKAGDDETAGNPRARSAVLRVAEKLPSLPEAA